MGSSSNATIVVTLKEDVDNGVFSLLLKGGISMAVDYGVARRVCMELKKSCSAICECHLCWQQNNCIVYNDTHLEKYSEWFIMVNKLNMY